MRGKTVKKVFVLRLTEKEEVKDLAEFQAKSVFLGRPPADSLVLAMRRFNQENPVGCTLVSEAKMLEWLRGKKLGMTRQTLKAIRDQKCPEGTDPGDGTRIWASDGVAVIYNREGMTRFVKASRSGRREP